MLGDDAIARYARQIVVPGVGASGQEKLLATTVLIVGDARGVAQAAVYLEAAGLRVRDGDPSHADLAHADLARADLVVVAGTGSLAAPLLEWLRSCGKPVCWYAIEADGFTAGVHPEAPLPSNDQPLPAAAEWHDVAACDAASLACAIAAGLPHRRGLVRFRE